MEFGLARLGQVALPVRDVDVSETFYRDALGLRHLYRFVDLTFFDCAGVRLLLEKADGDVHASTFYFACADIALGVRVLVDRGVVFTGPPHLIAPMADHDLWMAFFNDPDGHTLALMQEAPKGYRPG
jgi:methylmalonyl-CoA/ethylmalonyl-CoA epimerase